MCLFRRVSVVVVLMLMAGSLSGCGSISSFVAGSMGDLIPTWAGGLPADAPPRPGTAKYDEFIRQHDPVRQESASKNADKSAPSSAEAIH